LRIGSGTPFNFLVFLLFFWYIYSFFISVWRSVSFSRDHHAGDSLPGIPESSHFPAIRDIVFFFIKQDSPIRGQEQYGTEVYS
jgi:hypothetical protein